MSVDARIFPDVIGGNPGGLISRTPYQGGPGGIIPPGGVQGLRPWEDCIVYLCGCRVTACLLHNEPAS